jgi:hypothetical protein
MEALSVISNSEDSERSWSERTGPFRRWPVASVAPRRHADHAERRSAVSVTTAPTKVFAAAVRWTVLTPSNVLGGGVV